MDDKNDPRRDYFENKVILLEERLAKLEAKIDQFFGADPVVSEQIELTPPPPTEKKEKTTGSFLGILGIIFIILAAVFLIKLSVQSGWLTPFRQWSLVSLVGITIIGFAYKFNKHDNQYSALAAASGAVILFFAAYSSHLIFSIVPILPSVLIAGIVSICCIALLSTFKNDFFTFTTVTGTYLCPLLLGHYFNNTQLMSVYFIIWTIVFSWISSFLQSRSTSLVASYMAIGVFSYINLKATMIDLPLIIAVQFVLFAVLIGGVVRYTLIFQKPLNRSEAFGYFPPLIFFYGTQYYFLSIWLGKMAPWVALSIAMLLLGIYFFAVNKLKDAKKLESLEMILAFVCVVVFHAGYLNLLPDRWTPTLLSFILVAILVFKNRFLNFESSAIKLTLSVIAFIEFGKVAFSLTFEYDLMFVLVGLSTSVLMFINYFLLFKNQLKNSAAAYLVLTHFISVLTIYRIAETHGSLIVSISWFTYSMIVFAIAFRKKDWIFAKSSLIVLFVSTAKVLLYDVSQASGVVRILCLFLTGGLLYFSGYLFRKIGDLENK